VPAAGWNADISALYYASLNGCEPLCRTLACRRGARSSARTRSRIRWPNRFNP